jgi:predicted ATP-grasp superfamily ATP-dependent carboligase
MAAAAGFDVPPTHRVQASNGAVVERLGYPAVVKPPRSELPVNGRLQRFESQRVDHPRGLAEALGALPGGIALVQPYLDGSLVTVNGVAWKGEVVAAVHQVGIRIWPEHCGALSYAKTIPPDPELDRGARELIGGLRWSGLFNLQLIESGGSRYAIDLNPRTYQSLALATAAGVNLTAIWAQLLLGGRPEVGGYRAGVWFRSEEDLRAILRLAATGHRREALRALVPRRRTVHAVFSVRDPGPVMTLARRVAGRRVCQNPRPWPGPRPRR